MWCGGGIAKNCAPSGVGSHGYAVRSRYRLLPLAAVRMGGRGIRRVRRAWGMGATHVAVTIRNPAEPERAWEGLFLVDTGATDSLVPRAHMEAIGLAPKGNRTYELADGSELTLDVTTADIEFMDEIVGGTVIFGEEGAEPLLGVTALESAGIEVDPVNQRLKRLPAVRLKGMRG